MVLRTGRFFPEDDDTHRDLSGPNIKANEFLNRRLTVEDAAEAHVVALEKAPALGFETFILSAPPPFAREDCRGADRRRAGGRSPAIFPTRAELYARAGWSLPASIDRVYDPSRAERLLGFRCRTDFAAVLEALASGEQLPFAHDPSYVSPKETSMRRRMMLKRALAMALGWVALAGMQAPRRAAGAAAAVEMWRLDCGEVTFTDFNAFFSDTSEYRPGRSSWSAAAT